MWTREKIIKRVDPDYKNLTSRLLLRTNLGKYHTIVVIYNCRKKYSNFEKDSIETSSKIFAVKYEKNLRD